MGRERGPPGVGSSGEASRFVGESTHGSDSGRRAAGGSAGSRQTTTLRADCPRRGRAKEIGYVALHWLPAGELDPAGGPNVLRGRLDVQGGSRRAELRAVRRGEGRQPALCPVGAAGSGVVLRRSLVGWQQLPPRLRD